MEVESEIIVLEEIFKGSVVDAIKAHVSDAGLDQGKLYYKTLFSSKRVPKNLDGEISPDGSSVVITFDEREGIGSTLKSPMVMSRSEARICGHHVTFDCISQGHKERKLREIFSMDLPGDVGDLTPDFDYDDGKLNILEFATTMAGDERSLTNICYSKINKYLDIINRFSMSTGKVTTYHVIVVGRNGVMSTLNLSPSICTELVYRYRMSCRIIDLLISLGITQASKEEFHSSKIVGELKKMMEEIEFNFDTVGEWTESNYKNWIAPLTEDEHKNIRKNLYIAARKARVKVEKEVNKRGLVDSQLDNEANYLISKFKESLVGNNNVRMDAKPVTIFPLFLPKARTEFYSFDFSKVEISIRNQSAMDQAWSVAISQAKNSESYYFEEDLSDLYKKSFLESEPKVSEGRSAYKRVHIEMTEEEWLELARKGIRAKKYKGCDEIKTKVMKSKQGFSPSVNVDDVSDFIVSRDLFHPVNTLPGYITDYNNLLRRANDLAENSGTVFYNLSENVMRLFMMSKFFHYCCLITEIAVEVAMSLRQNCKTDDFIIKTLKYHDVMLLIKPTNSSGHIFFSILVQEENCDLIKDLPFTTFSHNNGNLITEFVSANAQQLSHWATTAAMSLILFSSWVKNYNVNIKELKSLEMLSSDITQMMNLSLIVFLEQKTSTEEILTLFRYVSMEGFKDYPGFCDSLKVLSKMPTMMRSRLSIWCLNKVCLEAAKLYGKGYKYTTRITESGREKSSWKELRNPYTGGLVETPGLLVNLYYLGYLRNKHTKSSNNQDMALISKILKGELEYIKASDKDTLGSCMMNLDENHNPHNYDVGFIKAMSDQISYVLADRLSTSDSKVVEEMYLQALSTQSIDVFMTLKASSSFKPGDELKRMDLVENKMKEIKRLNKLIGRTEEVELSDELRQLKEQTESEISDVYRPGPRPRVIEEFSDIVTNYIPPALYLKKSLAICQQYGLMIDIFKKPQQGGLREIYVITRESRMIQYSIETLSRVLCREFESETMTHPKNKVNLLTNHGAKTRAISDQRTEDSKFNKYSFSILNSNSSKDKKSWNNTNSPSKFAIMLLRLTPKRLHPFIFNSLKLWDTKNMLLPEGIRSIIVKGKLWDIGDPIMNEFIDSYSTRNETFKSVIHEGRPFITIKTGMMQGILHFTSSLSHTGFNLLMKSYFTSLSSRIPWIYDSLFTHLESSDDSAYLKTLTVKPSFKREALRFLYSFDLYTTELSPLAGFHESFQKSSLHSSRVVEFNSEFCFDNQVNKPNWKHEVVSLRIPENESLSETCYLYKNLSSTCLESGSSILQVHFIQRAQALIHYTTMGLTLNPFFKDLSKCLIRNTDPGLGFFPLDPCMLSGVVDHQFNVWMLMKGNPFLAAKTSRILETEKISSYSCGTVLKSAILQFGDRKRWRRIVDHVEEKIGKLDYREFVKNKPHLLFMRPKTKEELVAYHFLKLYTPNVISSLGNVGRMDRMLIRGGYMIQNRCITVGSLWDELIEDKSKRTSLFKLCIENGRLAYEKLLKLKSINLLPDDLEVDLNNIKKFLEDCENDESRKHHEALYSSILERSDMVDSRILSVSQQSNLFPQFREYLSILTCHRTLSNSGTSEWKTFEKKRALVPVLMAPTKDILSLESICMIKWFSYNPHHLPKSILKDQWSKFRLAYSWLENTFEGSFANSNFENEISFANFIKEQTGKNRSLYVTSAPLKVEDGHSALFSLITRHTWPGMLLKAKEGVELLNKASKDVLHPLAVLAGLEVTSSYKMEILNSLVKDPNYDSAIKEFLASPPNSMRERRLRPILMHLTGSKKSQVLTELLVSRTGVLGAWTTRERYDSNTRSYVGNGVWSGCVDKLAFSVLTTNSCITEIKVNSGLHFRTYFNMFKEWMNESRLKFADSKPFDSNRINTLVASIRNGVLYDTPGTNNITPVYEDKTITYKTDGLSFRDMKVEITPFAIQLKANIPRGKGAFANHVLVTIISARLLDSDVLLNPMKYNVSNRIISLIINNVCLGDKRLNVGPKTAGSSRVSFLEPSTSMEASIQGLINYMDRNCVDLDAGYTLSKLSSQFKLRLDMQNVDSDVSYACLRRLLPSRLYQFNRDKKEDLLQTVREHIRTNKYKTNFIVPDGLEIDGAWDRIFQFLHVLSMKSLMKILTCITNRPIVIIDKRSLGTQSIDILFKHELRDLDSIYLSNCDIILLETDNARVRSYLLTKETVKQFKTRDRLVTVLQDVKAEDYEWKAIFEDLITLKLIVENRHADSNKYESGFKAQLKKWLCKSMCQGGVITASTFQTLSKDINDEEEEPPRLIVDVSEPDNNDIDDLDDFMDFLDTEEGGEMVDMFTKEPDMEDDADDDAASTTSSIENLPIKSDELEALFALTSTLERYGKVKCSSIRLFDSLVVKSRDTYDGFLTRPHSNIVKNGVNHNLFTIFNFFLDGQLQMQSFDVEGIPLTID